MNSANLQDSNAPTQTLLTPSGGPLASVAGGNSINIQIDFVPSVLVKIGSYIKLTVPSEFKILAIINTNCQSTTNFAAFSNSAACTRRDNVITMITTNQINNAVYASIFYSGIMQTPIN